MNINIDILGIFINTVIVLLGVAAAWGSLRADVKAIHYRLDRLNGRLDAHDLRLANQGERMSTMEGRQKGMPPQSPSA